jgi:hypothetical protein
MIAKFMKEVKEEKNGFKFGKVFRFDEESVVAILPILREKEVERKYVVLPEAVDVKIEDTGKIDSAEVTNNGNKPIYIRSGTILKGRTQERATVIGRVVFPNETKVIKVVCVHQTRGISAGAKMDYLGITPSSINLSSQNTAWDSTSELCCSLRAEGVAGFGEGADWTPPPTDDLASYVKDFSDKIDKILPKIEHKKNQTGMVLFDVEGVYAIEIFDLTPSWKALRDDVVKKDGEKIIKKDLQGLFQLKPERANELAMAVLGQEYKQKELHKNKSKTYSVESDKYIGQGVVLDGEVIHFNLIRKD